jgi:chaperonin GroEL
MKRILNGTAVREALLKGVNQLADIVKVTMGNKGRTVVLTRGLGNPVTTKDGVTVAKAIHLKDEFEDAGAQLAKQVAIRTNDEVGDGTTTATVLLQAILKEGMPHIQSGVNVQKMKEGMEQATKEIIEQLKEQSEPVEDIKGVASVSANSEEVGDLIAQAYEAVGQDGVVRVEESNDTRIDTVKGIEFHKGALAQHFPREMDYPFIGLVHGEVSTLQELMKFMQTIRMNEKKEAVLFCKKLSGEARQTIIVNNHNGTFMCLVVEVPEGPKGKDILDDIAALSGGTVIEDLNKLTQEDLGKAREVVATDETTTILDGEGDATSHIQELKDKTPLSDFEKKGLKERIAQLSGGISIIYVGGATEVEMRETVDRVQDAVHATKAAIEEGVVDGGGVALMNLAKEIEVKTDQDLGSNILYKALNAPLLQIISNSGTDIQKHLDAVYKLKIKDPVKVTRVALENAVSVASQILSTEAAVVDENESDNN